MSEVPKQRVMLIAGFILILPSLVLTIGGTSSDTDLSRGFARFANAFLTTYTFASIFLSLICSSTQRVEMNLKRHG